MWPGGVPTAALVCAALLLPIGAAGDPDRRPAVGRRGAFMGLDPGLALRVEDGVTPLYARLDLRVGGCLDPRFQLGLDWRMDLLVTVEEGAMQKRHELGPVATVFLVRGWFARIFAHVGGFDPFLTTVGGQTGYEFSAGRFSAVGFALCGDADIRYDGEPPPGYSFSLALYLTAYDLGTRRGREE
jgi:hypothetical protein